MEERICTRCYLPLDPDAHGNSKMHLACSYEHKKERQKNKYKTGNPAKLTIQKNEIIAARLHKMDPSKQGYLDHRVSEAGFRFNCNTIRQTIQNEEINVMDQYGYSIKKNDDSTLIYFYHVSELK